MEAKQPISYLIRLNRFLAADTVQSFCVDNAKTNEKLVIKVATRRWGPMTISRYPMEAAEEWIKEMDKYADGKYEHRTVRICF
jgi:hypothetical protein